MSSKLVLINPIKKNENPLIYSKNTVYDIYDGLLRQSGKPIFEEHIQKGVDLIPNVVINPSYRLIAQCIYYWHDVVEDFFEFGNSSDIERKIFNKSFSGVPGILKGVINPYDIRNHQIPNHLNISNYNLILNSLFEKAGEIGENISFGVYKITKRINDEDYLEEVLKFSNISNTNFNLISKEKMQNLDLTIVLDKIVDIYNNNLDYREVSLDDNKYWPFLGKKLRNSLDKYFFDDGVLGKFEKILLENKDIKVNEENLFDFVCALDLLYETRDNILNFFEFHSISDILENNGLGSKVNYNNIKHYKSLLDRLYCEKSYLFDKEPKLVFKN